MATLTWLHLSDLHFRASKAIQWDADIVLKALLDDVAALIQSEARPMHPDFIAITGDIAYSGKPEEYDLAQEFLDALLRLAGLGKDRLFLVPGNHDVDRTLITEEARRIDASLQDRDHTNAILSDAAARRVILTRFEGYRSFVNSYLGPHLPFHDDSYFYSRRIDIGKKAIGVLGLNSSWVCGGDNDAMNGMLVGEWQARAALAQVQDADIRIALMHHPLLLLREFDRDDTGALLSNRCQFILHGHMHNAEGVHALLDGGDRRREERIV